MQLDHGFSSRHGLDTIDLYFIIVLRWSRASEQAEQEPSGQPSPGWERSMSDPQPGRGRWRSSTLNAVHSDALFLLNKGGFAETNSQKLLSI